MTMPIVPHVNRTEVTGLTKDGSYYTVDLTSFLQVTSGGVGVVLQYVNTSGTDYVAGYRSTGTATAKQITVYANSHQIIIVDIDSSNQVDIMCANSNIYVYIQSELGDGVVLRQTDNYYVHPNTPVLWKTITVQPLGTDTVSDVECALAFGVKTGGSQVYALRPLGATNDYIQLVQYIKFALAVKVNASGQYEQYIPSAGCGSPTVATHEIGYIKKGYGFHGVSEPADEAPSTNGSFGDMSLVGTAPKYTTAVAMRVSFPGTPGASDTSSIRANGSTNPADELRQRVWIVYYTKVDADRLIEYTYEGSQTVTFEVWGYQTDVPQEGNVLVLDTGTLTLDTATVTAG